MSNNLFGLLPFIFQPALAKVLIGFMNTPWLPFLLLVENTYVGNCLHAEQGLAVCGRKDVN